MASIQQSVADYIRAPLRALGVNRVGLLSVKAPESGGKSVICGVTVESATFEQQQDDEAPLIVVSALALDFIYEAQVSNPQNIKDRVYEYFLNELHGFAGRLKADDPFSIMNMALTSYGQSILEGTDLGVESYALAVMHHSIADRP